MSEEDDFRTEKISLTAEQWVGIIDSDGEWLPHCCGSIGAARGVLTSVLQASGQIDARQARKILCEIGEHDKRGIVSILNGTADGSMFWTREGSPWFEIVRACRALLGDGDIIEESRAHRRAEYERRFANAEQKRALDAKRIAQSFHDASERIASEYEASPVPYLAVPERVRRRAEAAFSELLAHDVIAVSHGSLPPIEAQPKEPVIVTIGVQINGRTIGTIRLPADASVEEAMRVALLRDAIRDHAASLSVERYKPGAILMLKTASLSGV